MTALLPSGSTAVMARRREPPDSLDFFPTPPWATRALVDEVLATDAVAGWSAWEPAAGEGHMAAVLAESFREVHASDVFDYGRGYAVGSFVGQGSDLATCPFEPDWIVTNPPFALAGEFALEALDAARVGVALLLRAAWLEGAERHASIFARRPPSEVAIFVERVAMTRGRWDPNASSATAYAWFVWRKDGPCWPVPFSRLSWIAPGRRRALTRSDDAPRFGVRTDAPLLEGALA